MIGPYVSDQEQETMPHESYPWWIAYAWDNPLRRLVHNPKHILGGLDHFFTELRETLKPSARLLMVEPYLHVSKKAYEREVKAARAAGFAVQNEPHIRISRAALLARS
jgi:hypothetical protein